MLGVHISRVRSLRLDQWPEETVTYMAERGNDAVNRELEFSMPPYYTKPKPSDPQVYREHFIHAKYERKEFASDMSSSDDHHHHQDQRLPYENETKRGVMYKRGKKDKSFRPRHFHLDTRAGTLKYFLKQEAKEPKHVIDLSRMRVFLAPDKINHAHGMQISFSPPNTRCYRHIYLYCEEAKDTVDWYICLRAAVYNHISNEQPDLKTEDILRLLDRQHAKQGYLFKTGPKKTEPFRKRWFSLENRSLIYFLSPLDAYPKGEIYIGNSADGFSIEEGWGTRKEEGGFGIVFRTPDREFIMYSDDKDDQLAWIHEINDVLSRPMSAKEIEEYSRYNSDKKNAKRRA